MTSARSKPASFTVGDRLIHTTKPEWGVGTVSKAESTTHEGVACQRLTIRFARGGLKTLSTAFAKLRAADDAPAIDKARDSVRSALSKPAETAAAIAKPSRRPPPGMAGPAEAPPEEGPAIDPAVAREIMSRVPDAARDPFQKVEDRLRETLNLYRYDATGGSLLDWASAQSGLSDPLGSFSRHELEQYFERFQILLGQHLANLVAEARKEGVDTKAIMSQAPQAARRAVQRVNPRR